LQETEWEVWGKGNSPLKIRPRMATLPVKGHFLSIYVPAYHENHVKTRNTCPVKKLACQDNHVTTQNKKEESCHVLSHVTTHIRMPPRCPKCTHEHCQLTKTKRELIASSWFKAFVLVFVLELSYIRMFSWECSGAQWVDQHMHNICVVCLEH
jgi:hypothetical protein